MIRGQTPNGCGWAHRLGVCPLILLALFLAACGPKVKLPKLEAGATVLAFGDSLTFGTGARTAESYPAVLERLTGLKVVNAGVPGEVSADGLARLPEAIDEVKPALIILCHGGNDFLQRKDEGTAAANVRAMVQLAKSRGIPVVLLATPKPGIPPGVPKFYGEIGEQEHIPVEDHVLASVLIDNRLKSDLVHPNAKGYAEVADTLQKLLKKSGAL
ncbi:MAG TPA: GDSL-type esterase/lipase family protein [Usitatibacter sp.]